MDRITDRETKNLKTYDDVDIAVKKLAEYEDREENDDKSLQILDRKIGLADKKGIPLVCGCFVKCTFGTGVIKFGLHGKTCDTSKTEYGFYIEWGNKDLRQDIGYWLKDIEVIGIL